MRTLVITSLLLMGFASCNAPENQNETPADEVETIAEESPESEITSEFAPQSVDDELAEQLASFLTTDYLAEDLEYIEEQERVFQFFKVDLNDDGEEEYFVRFMNSWFCGSGGCTFFLLSGEGEMITKFTVTNPPIFVEPTIKNGWAILLVKDRGEWKELVYENGSYPANPTVLPKASYDAPSGHALVMFDEESGRAKTYSF